MRHEHHLVGRIPPQIPRRVVNRHELRLAVPRRHRHADTVLAAGLDVLQQRREAPVVRPHLIVCLHVLAELDQIIPAGLHVAALLQLVDHLLDLEDLVVAVLVDVVQHHLQLFRREPDVGHGFHVSPSYSRG